MALARLGFADGKAGAVIFVGLDLAWSVHRPSGVVLLKDHAPSGRLRILEARVLSGHPEVRAFLATLSPPQNFGILADAPLVGTGPFRRADRALLRFLRPWRIGVLPFGRLDFRPIVRQLQSLGFALYPPNPAYRCRQGGWVVEVYPQATAVGLVGDRLPYKRGRKAEQRRAWNAFWRKVLRHLAPLGLYPEPPGGLENVHLQDAWVAALGGAAACLTGRARRFPEDPGPGEAYIWVPWLLESRGEATAP